MAATVSVLKLTQVHGVVKVRGTGAGTIALATTLKKSSESVSAPIVHIKSLYYSLASGASATIVRNSQTLWTLNDQGSGWLDFAGWSDNEESTSNIVVTFTGGDGTVVLELTKVAGYGPQQHQDADGDLG
jgi:hypothetical protein